MTDTFESSDDDADDDMSRSRPVRRRERRVRRRRRRGAVDRSDVAVDDRATSRRRGDRRAEADAEVDVEATPTTLAVELADAELLEIEEVPEAEPSPFDRPGRWYVVHTYAGYENKVKSNLASRVRSMNVEDRIFEVVIPMEDVIEFKNGRKVVVQKKVFPGYLLVRMGLDDDAWYVVRNTPGVTGFVGSGAKPDAALAQGGRGHPRHRREDRRPGGREEGAPAARVRGRRAGARRHRPVRRLQRRDQRDRRRPLEAQGAREHLRSRDPVELEFADVAKL